LKIHLITNLYHPDELAGASLYTDIARCLHEAGHEVRVTAAFSYYPAWKRRPEDEGVSWRDEVHEGIPVRRCSMYIPAQPRGLTRLLSDLTFLASLITKGTFSDWTPDVVITACPMLSQCLAQRFLYLGKSVKRLIVVQDFVVDAALELGILKLPGLGTLLPAVERYALRSADVLTTISPEMLVKLRERVGEDKPLHYVPNWIHRDLDAEIARQSGSKAVIEEKTLFYSGNLGIKQGLPDFLEDFANLNSDWRIRIQGNGPEAARIRELSSTDRITLGDVENVPAYVTRLRQATACLVTQRAGVSANFLPSKLLPALAAHTPVLAVAESDTPLAKEVTTTGYGLVVSPGDQVALAAALDQLASPDVRAQMSARAAERARFFHRERVMLEFASLLEKMIPAS
jgi:colanic acid biosynthesis glycosyl transferase WcaI